MNRHLIILGLVIGMLTFGHNWLPVRLNAEVPEEEGWNIKKTKKIAKCDKCDIFLEGCQCEQCKKEGKEYLFRTDYIVFGKCPVCGSQLTAVKWTDSRGKCIFCNEKAQMVRVVYKTIYACPDHPDQEFLKEGRCSQETVDSQGKTQKCGKKFLIKSIKRSEVISVYKCPDEKCKYYYAMRPTLSGRCPMCGNKLHEIFNTCKACFKPRPPATPSPDEINKAIEHGTKYLVDLYGPYGFDKPLSLKAAGSAGGEGGGFSGAEIIAPSLVIYTLIRCGISKDDPLLKAGIDYLLKTPLENLMYPTGTLWGEYPTYIYSVPLAIMALENLDCDLHHERIAELTQFIVDAQDPKTGAWGYPQPLGRKFLEKKGITSGRETAILVETGLTREGTKVKKRTVLKKGITARDTGFYPNHSSVQFALLGLRAAERSGVVVPEQTWREAKKYLLWLQGKDGSWGYEGLREKGYGSMTLAGIAGLIICKYYLGEKDYKNDPCINKAMEWINSRFVVNENPDTLIGLYAVPNAWYFYYFYCIERMAVLAEIESIDGIEWYPLVASQLLFLQQLDGRWDSVNLIGDKSTRKKAEQFWSHPIVDTCFALLCLKKTTIALPVTTPKAIK